MRKALIVAVLVAWPNLALAEPLPEGDTGIAAGYPDDVGIANAPGVVFADDFEDANGQLEVGKWDNVWGDVVITQDPANVHAGSKSVQITHVNPQSHGAWRDFGQNGFDTLHLRYYMKYDPAFPGVHHSGMAIHAGAPGWDIGTGTGVKPNGSTHFTALLDNLAPFFDWSPPGNAPPGYSYIYCYHMDQGSNYGDVFLPSGEVMPGSPDLFGPDFVPKPDIILERGKWIAFEIMVRANTAGMEDGRVAFWVDGVLAADFMELRLRSVDALKANCVVLSSYSSEVFPNQVLTYDDVVAATSYIGPMAGESPAATSSSNSASAGPGSGGSSSAGPAGAGGSSNSATPREDESAGGCGCRLAPLPTHTSWLAGLALLALLRRRR